MSTLNALEHIPEPTTLDKAASKACTQPGAFALLLSMALVSLIPYWLQGKQDNALGRYVSLRLGLATAVELLDESVIWQKYKAANPPESPSIKQLLETSVEVATGEPTPKATKEKQAQASSTRTGQPDSNRGPAAATAREKHLFEEQKKKVAQKIAGYVPAVGKDVSLNCLTVRDLQELAEFELPKIPDTTNYGTRTGKEVDISPGSLPRNLYMASIFSEGLLLFAIVYFSAFTHEATSSLSFPSPGTLFGAFSVSRWTLAMFSLALLTPIFASVTVAVTSRRLVLAAGSILVSSAVLSVLRVLSRRSYLRPLVAWPARLREDGAPAKREVPAREGDPGEQKGGER